MENIGIYATKDVNINDIIKDTIKEVNEGMSLICDNLIKEAENNTNTLEEYKAYMKGAAFVFRCVAKRNDPNRYGTPETISTIESAIKHCIKLLPFMDDIEKEEHLKLIGWLNKLLSLEGKETIRVYEQFK